ncbi:hypothetical protein [Prosthecobacter sp.]|uniref:hypothetical protein n=1 Tax=Prosthecobacter sp. TaxID=1965333 RepID=UPI003782F35B
MQSTEAASTKSSKSIKKTLQRVALLGIGIVLGAAFTLWYDYEQGDEKVVVSALGKPLRPGPWGDVYFTSFVIAAPEELLPLRKLEEAGTRWVFPHASYTDVAQLLKSTEMPVTLQAELMEPGVLVQTPDGLEILPHARTLLALPAEPRKKLYQALLRYPENRGQITFIHKDTLGERFGRNHNCEHTLMLFKQLCCEHGDYLVFCGYSVMLSQLPTYEEKRDFMRGLTSQRTLTLRLLIKSGSDTTHLANYWGKGLKSTDVRTIFESIAREPTGGTLGVINVLPPLPSSQMFFYPMPDNPLNGPAPLRDCHWTSFNFFQSEPNEQLSKPEYFMQKLKEDYLPASGDPRYGDIALFTTPAGDIVHSAVYLADDVLYTKNGATFTYPWMLETLPDLLKQYSFQVEPGQKLLVNYFRNKNM